MIDYDCLNCQMRERVILMFEGVLMQLMTDLFMYADLNLNYLN